MPRRIAATAEAMTKPQIVGHPAEKAEGKKTQGALLRDESAALACKEARNSVTVPAPGKDAIPGEKEA